MGFPKGPNQGSGLAVAGANALAQINNTMYVQSNTGGGFLGGT
jgi:hypothetical protein